MLKKYKKRRQFVIVFAILVSTFLLSIYRTGFPPVLLIMMHLQAKITIYTVVTAIWKVVIGPQKSQKSPKIAKIDNFSRYFDQYSLIAQV